MLNGKAVLPMFFVELAIATSPSATIADNVTSAAPASASTTTSPTPPCGKRAITASGRIVGGDEATPGEWPWQALMQFVFNGDLLQQCGGTLINERWIVSAAHCVFGYTYPVYMTLGAHDYLQHEDHAQLYPVSRIIVHEDYNPSAFENDISLIQLPVEVDFTDYVIPACLPTHGENVTAGTECWITGWGQTQDSSEPQNILREALIPVVSQDHCQAWMKPIHIMDDHICIGYPEGGVGACFGDSGGPLVCQNSSSSSSSPFVLQGIASFVNYGCARPVVSTVYGRMSRFVDWVHTTMEENAELDPFFNIPVTPCGSVITQDQILRLPVDEKTQAYLPNMKCNWTIQSRMENAFILLNFSQRFGVEKVSGYCRDFVRISHSNGDRIGYDLCGHSTPDRVEISLTKPEDIYVTFESDATNQFEGFALQVQFLTANINGTGTCTSDCNCLYQLQGNETGVVTSSDYPHHYPNDLNCFYQFFAEPGQRIEIVFNGRIESCCDYILVYDEDLILDYLRGNLSNVRKLSSGEAMSFRFVTDFAVAYEGFQASYRQINSPGETTSTTAAPPTTATTECGGSFVLADASIYHLSSPGFPGRSPTNLDCSYYLQALYDSRITISILGSLETIYDYLEIRDHGYVDRMTGNFSRNYTSRGSNIELYYHTHWITHSIGFTASFHRYGVCPNDGVFLLNGTDTGVVVSPGYPASKYPNNLNCFYKFIAQSGFRVEIFLEGETASCCDDYIRIYDGNVTLGTLIGSIPSTRVLSNSSVLGLSFVTGYSGRAGGFQATYKQIVSSENGGIYPGNETAPDAGVCEYPVFELVGAEVQIVTSPGYPSRTPNNFYCWYYFIALEGFRISFSIEGSVEEGYDYVEIYERDTRGIFWTGNFSETYVSEGRIFFMIYHTDSSAQSIGFEATFYQFLVADTTDVTTASPATALPTVSRHAIAEGTTISDSNRTVADTANITTASPTSVAPTVSRHEVVEATMTSDSDRTGFSTALLFLLAGTALSSSMT